MIAALPMYDRAETAGANDRLWAGIREELRTRGLPAPEALTRDRPLFDIWTDPALVLAQTCGYPYRARLHGRVTLVGTPDHGLPGCPPGHYCSVFLARQDGPPPAACRRLAYNETLSQSGYAAALRHAAAEGWRFGSMIETGSHRGSARAVAEGRADLAALDVVSWEMMRRWDAFAAQLREVARTRPTPALPYIAAAGAPAAVLFDAIGAAIAALSPEDRDCLCLTGICAIPAADYLAVPNPPAP